MRSGKKDDVRFYEGRLDDVIDRPIEKVLERVLSFDKRCNNEHKDRRIYTDKKMDCPYQSGMLIESVIVKDLKKRKLEKNELKRFLVKRRSYNRGLYTYNDLIRVFRYKDGYKVTMTMLSDKEAKDYIDSPLEKVSVMQTSGGVYYITPVGKNKTRYNYIWTCSTDHWLLNKSVTVSSFFESMAENIRGEFNTLKI